MMSFFVRFSYSEGIVTVFVIFLYYIKRETEFCLESDGNRLTSAKTNYYTGNATASRASLLFSSLFSLPSLSIPGHGAED